MLIDWSYGLRVTASQIRESCQGYFNFQLLSCINLLPLPFSLLNISMLKSLFSISYTPFIFSYSFGSCIWQPQVMLWISVNEQAVNAYEIRPKIFSLFIPLPTLLTVLRCLRFRKTLPLLGHLHVA